VGAGGIGFTITKYMALFQYDRLLGALIFIVLMVTIVDRFSDYVRSKLI
jgi:phosphonate transport system permease protein